jgi:amino-acid N-acetyltransferase
MIITQAHVEEVEIILSLFEEDVRAGKMLPRSPENVRVHLSDWLVAKKHDEIIGCVSLVYFNQALCEIRSLAVRPDYRGNGVAGQLIAAAVDMAHANGVRQVLALTRAASVFERAGFHRDYVTNFPEKVWRDCTPCPFRAACDEIALTYDLRQENNHD